MVHDDTALVDTHSSGLVGPESIPGVTIQSGGRMRCLLPSGCLGPIITRHFRGGHETTRPVFVEGAHPGDALAISIERLVVKSRESKSWSASSRSTLVAMTEGCRVMASTNVVASCHATAAVQPTTCEGLPS